MEASDEKSPERLVLAYGKAKIAYSVIREERPVCKIAIDVEPNGSVIVKAHHDASVSAIHQAIHSKARWVHDHVVEAQKRFRHVLEREYVSGEEVIYLGKRHQLKLVDVSKAERRVRLYRGKVEVLTETRDSAAIRLRLRAWYKFRAQHVFAARIKELSTKLPWIASPPQFELLEMQKRWGSCATDGILRINPFLVKAPRDCIDHVLIHELCHLKEHNHSKGFYALLDRYHPGWQPLKAQLDDWAEVLLNE